jgi:hypothetical protein
MDTNNFDYFVSPKQSQISHDQEISTATTTDQREGRILLLSTSMVREDGNHESRV